MGEKKKEGNELQRKPHFFKVLIGEFKLRLKMPPNFLKHISNEASQKAMLEGPNGCSWPVEITRSFDGTFISSGWSKFVEDHSLKEQEFLVFRYNGNMHFSIQVFDTTACEREDLFPIQSYMKPKLPKERKKRGRPRKHPLNVVCHIECKETKSEPQELPTCDGHEAKHMQDDIINSVEDSFLSYQKLKLTKGGKKRGRPRKHPPDVVRCVEHHEIKSEHMHDDIINLVEDSFLSCKKLKLTTGERKRGRPRKHPPDVVHQIEHQETKGSRVATLSPNEEGKVKLETEELSSSSIASENPNERGYFSRRRLVTTTEQLRAEEAARSFSSDLPFVIRPMALSSIYERMRFPLSFSKKHLPRKKTSMTLRDPNGRSWTVAYVAAEKDRDRLSIGWGEFAQGNNLDVGDYCAFELIGPNEMRVHIFRAVEDTIPAVEETAPAVETPEIVGLD
ncbi:uncharacterized protein A4U43_C05F26510 [Asparagus officinalis]|uniref:TF-B3 domain-containing protein n=1 Tax=Asparagus officinalis TaxID=4686 RepID=A0A5P1EUN8_ASPOF|nr:B3 domain-containing protein Os01g0723500-like [Asparagus officinalis]ONK69768.1 uncharacterized protein A4U43_C05F26510 [Asparagus officinalis]